MKKLLVLFIAIIVLTPFFAQAGVFQIYPTYGYNQTDHLCQIRESFEGSGVNLNVDGEYWGLRECRVKNPEIILFTGFGIILWVLLFTVIIVKNFYILPKSSTKKITTIEKRIGVLWESFLIAFSMFVLILLLHYFAVPQTFYDYGSDIDQIIYNLLIDGQIPFYYILLYIFTSLLLTNLKKRAQ